VFGREWQERELSRPLEGDVQRALMSSAGAGLAAWLDLAAFREEAAQSPEVLVVDLFDLVDAELADLTTGGEFSAAAAAAEFTGSATWSRAGAA
jgi:hypothetical protein